MNTPMITMDLASHRRNVVEIQSLRERIKELEAAMEWAADRMTKIDDIAEEEYGMVNRWDMDNDTPIHKARAALSNKQEG